MQTDALMIITFDNFQKIRSIGSGDAGDSLILMFFYYQCAKFQKTNTVWANTSFCAKGLGFSVKKVRRLKKHLMDLGIVSEVPAKGGEKAYMKIHMKFKNENLLINIEDTPEEIRGGKSCTPKKRRVLSNSGGAKSCPATFDPTNAYSLRNENAYSHNKKKDISKEIPTKSLGKGKSKKIAKKKDSLKFLKNEKYDSLLKFKNIYSTKTLKILKTWIDCGGKVHKKLSAKNVGAVRINDMIDEITMKGRNPFISVLTKEQHDQKLGTKKFTVKEIRACIKKFYEMGKIDELSGMYFDSFIFFQYKGKYHRGMKNYSPLISAFAHIETKAKHTKLSKWLIKKLEDVRPDENVADIHYIRAAKAIKKLNKTYKPNPSNSHVHFNMMEVVFKKFVLQMANDRKFKLFSIGQEWFVDRFVEDGLANYRIVKK